MKVSQLFSGGSRVLVLGTGISGRAMSSWCLRQGRLVAAGDPAGASQGLLDQRVSMRHGPVSDAWLEDIDTVLMSPGISPGSPQVAGLLAAARTLEIPVLSELDLFVDALAELAQTQHYRPEVVAITGTNGKTTTTMLTTRMLVAGGRHAVAAGNVGPTLMDTLTAAMEADDLPDTWVLELSSFQLSYGANFVPTIGVLLNITPDHLDWHGTFAEYARAKFRVLDAPVSIVCRDDAVVMDGVQETDATGSVVTIGSGTPANPGDLGIHDGAGQVHIVRGSANGELVPILSVEAMGIRGNHGLIDAQASLAVVEQLGALQRESMAALTTYEGEPHRTERVANISGVDYIDDSKATNVAATLAAIESCAGYHRVVLILGGEAKGQTFERLADSMKRNVGCVLTFGRAAGLLEAALAGLGVPVERAHTLPQAVARAAQLAQPGDAVLLSPACASTDAFANFAERGRCFQSAVGRLSSSLLEDSALGESTVHDRTPRAPKASSAVGERR